MGFIIEDGTGTSNTVKVDSENMLASSCVTSSTEHHANHKHGTAFSVNFSATPTGAGDCFLYVKNTDEEDLVIEGFGLMCEADEYFDVKLGDVGTPVGGSAVTPVNLNAGSGKTATGTFQNGNDITGLSGGSVAYRIYHTNTKGTGYNNFEMDLIIPKNNTLTIYCQTGTTALAGFVDMYYHGSEN